MRGIFWMGSAAFPFVAAMAILAWDASIGSIAALAGSAALLAFLQLQRPRPRALPVVLVIAAVAGAQMPVQSAENRAALMVAVPDTSASKPSQRWWSHVGPAGRILVLNPPDGSGRSYDRKASASAAARTPLA